MSYCVPERPQPAWAHDVLGFSLLLRLSCVFVVCSLLVLSGCGYSSTSSKAAAAAPSPTTPTPTALTISASLPAATMGSSYSGTLTVTGGTAPYSFSVASGQMPSGVLLGASTGVISGTPTAAGTFSFAVMVSDATGVSQQQALQIAVSSPPPPNPPPPTGNVASFSNLQSTGGWGQYGQGPPTFVDCSPSPCDGITFAMTQGVSSPSMSGNAAQFDLGGTAVYTDALFNNHLIGAFSSQGLPDTNKTLVPTLHNFTYDVYFYGTNLAVSQALEFDINQFFNSMGFIWGHECRIAGGNQWDIWDNQNAHWTPTGVACYPNANAWNHLTIQVQRTSNNELLYQSITFNGVTNTLNTTFPPGPAPSNWYGVTINYQMDGDFHQDPYSIYLDNITFSYE